MLYAEQGELQLSDIWITDDVGDVRSKRFDPSTFISACADTRIARVVVVADGYKADRISVWLRPKPEDAEKTGCPAQIILNGRELGPALLGLLASLCKHYSVSQGLIAGFSQYDYAAVETDVVLMKNGVDQDTSDRQWNDRIEDSHFGTKLRRLYPVTIIGKAIWESLPPLPALERPPEVRDLGDCKMLIAWPDLCSPHDPDFLAGTRELRQWLWPYTIQNPYDKLDLDV